MAASLTLDDGRVLSPEELDELARALDALRERTAKDLGAKDLAYLRRLVRLSRTLELAGRALLFFGFFPATWLLGTGLLALAKILENMEIGHNVMHGQYEFSRDPALVGRDYEWDMVGPSSGWRQVHNHMHHVHTNIVGVDRDVGYGFMRIADQQPWHPRFLLQPVQNLLLALFFEWGISFHTVPLKPFFRGEKSFRTVVAEVIPLLRKAARQVGKEYVLLPLVAGPAWAAVLAGNVVANVLRNVWAYAVIFCGHFTEGVRTFDLAETKDESRGGWYARQILGSSNLEGGPWFHILTGNLSHQIEHHLFPDLPACRYARLAPEVRAIAARFGLPYHTGSLRRQFLSVTRRILRYSLPTPTLVRESAQPSL